MKYQIDQNNFDACPEYNDWLDDQYTERSGPLDIHGFQPRPSFVLFSLSYATYQTAFTDFIQQQEEDLKQTVFDDFPAPIAYYFYRFENGFESELQRLHFLRDTWEGMIDVLHAITVAECRFRGLALALPIKFSDLLEDKMAQRLLTIERILLHATSQSISLDVGNIVGINTLGIMRGLNQSRNGFSHSAAQSEAQARAWIAECYEDVINTLMDVRGLSDVEIFRYLGQPDANTLRVEMFIGHSSTRTIRNIRLTAKQVQDSQRYFLQGQILAKNNNANILGLRPLMHFREDTAGHTTRLCLFRKAHGSAPNRRLEYEVVGEADRLDEERSLFSNELNEIRTLFGLGPD